MRKVKVFLLASISQAYIFAYPLIARAAPPAPLIFCDPDKIDAPGCAGEQGIVPLITAVLNIVFFISFILTLAFLIWGGVKWVLAQGEKEAIGKAREQVTNSLIGLVVILGSYIMMNVVLQLVLGKSLAEFQSFSLTELLK